MGELGFNKEPVNITKSEMLTNLDFLSEGAKWPPPSQVSRLERYRLNKSKFDNKLIINRDAYNYIISLVNDKFRVISYRMLINLYRKVTYKTADLLFVERPTYITDGGDQETLDQIVELSKLGSIGYEGAEDVSIYGDAIYTIQIGEDEEDEESLEKAFMGITNPRYWFPVVHESNLKKIKYHVLAWVVTRMETNSNNKKVETSYLIYQTHSKGSYTTAERKIADGHLGKETAIPEGEQETGLSDFAVVPTYGVTTSDTIFGIDDYTDMINLIDELQIRLEMIAHVLDKHSDPSLSGPASALEYDAEKGEYSVKLGGYFQRETRDDPDIKYVTWDGKTESSFKEIELILDLLAVITEMGSAIFDRESIGGNLSGRALKLLYVNPLTKVSRVRNNFDDAFKHALSLCSEVGYKEKIEKKDISIKWNDGLPDDPKELAEIAQIRTQKPTDTVAAQIQIQDGLNAEDANSKSDEVSIESAGLIPAIGAGAIDGGVTGDTSVLADSPENIEATKGLNGAQIKAAVDTLKDVSAGNIPNAVAVELLVAVGIAQEKAETMVAEQAKIKIESE